MLNFFEEHKNEFEFKNIEGDIYFADNYKSANELAFIKDVIKLYDSEIENKDRYIFEIKAIINKLNILEKISI